MLIRSLQSNIWKYTPAGFFDASLTDVLESPECPSDESRGAVLVQILARCGEGLMFNVFYALLGVSALSRVGRF